MEKSFVITDSITGKKMYNKSFGIVNFFGLTSLMGAMYVKRNNVIK